MRHIRKVPADRRTVVVAFPLNQKAMEVLGADDPCLYKTLEPMDGKRGWYVAQLEEAALIEDDLYERAVPGEFGFCHTAGQRRTASVAARRITEVLDAIRA